MGLVVDQDQSQAGSLDRIMSETLSNADAPGPIFQSPHHQGPPLDIDTDALWAGRPDVHGHTPPIFAFFNHCL
jgi:hypothetical protein